MVALSPFDSTDCQLLALTLLHFVWQGAVIAVLAAVGGALLRGWSSRGRYAVYGVAMLLMAACLPVTMAVVVATSPHADLRIARANDRPMTDTGGRDGEPVALLGRQASSVDDRQLLGAVPAGTKFADPAGVARSAVGAASPRLMWQAASPYLVGMYLLGLAVMLSRVAVSMYGGHRLRRDALAVDNDDVLAVIRRVAGRLGMRRMPLVAFCQRVSGPVVIGVLRPMVLLPVALTTGLTPPQLEAVLTHELAHLHRYDHLALMLQRLVEAMFFFHPAVWYVSRCLSDERENCCDDAVVAAGAPRLEYAELLLQLAARQLCRSPAPTGLAAVGERPSRLRQRVARLLDPAREPIRVGRIGACAILCLLAALVGPPALSYVLAAPSGRPTNRPTEQTERRGTELADNKDVGSNLTLPATDRDVVTRQETRQETRQAAADEDRARNVEDRLRVYRSWGDAARATPADQGSIRATWHRAVPEFLGLCELARQVGQTTVQGEPARLPRRLEAYRNRFADNLSQLIARDPNWVKAIGVILRRLPEMTFMHDAGAARPEPEPWVPQDYASYDSVRIDLRKLFEDPPEVDMVVDGENLAELVGDVMESIRTDPNGPQVDVRTDLVRYVGRRLTVVTESTPNRTDQRLLLGLELINTEKFTESLTKLLEFDPSFAASTRQGLRVWQMRDDVGGSLNVAVAHDYLLITPDVQLLDKVLAYDQDDAG